jgi:hypothetical protein
MENRNIGYRVAVKFLTLKGQTPIEIHNELKLVYKDNAPSDWFVKHWSKLFKWGGESLEDDECTGAPISITRQKWSKRSMTSYQRIAE